MELSRLECELCLEFERDLEDERDRGGLAIDLLGLECLERERDLE